MYYSKLNLNDLQYRGEGNASICFDINNSGSVLKLFKDEEGKCNERDSNSLSKQRGLLDYHENVIKDHLSETYLCGSFQLAGPFTEDLIIDLMKNVEEKRPLYRRKKTVDPRGCHGLIMEDACRLSDCSGSVLSVEIKPKYGALSGADTLCRYCMHQKLKLQEGKINAASRYCPSDLFSGDFASMEFALKALMENPQNNLRMFLNGKTCFAEKSNLEDLSFLRDCSFLEGRTDDERLNRLLPMIAQELRGSTYNPPRSQPTPFCANSESHRRGLKDYSITDESCLAQLLKSQTCSRIDVKRAADIYHSLNRQEGWAKKFWGQMTSNSVNSMTEDEKLLNDFLLSACVKDCSVIVTFGSSRQESESPFVSKIKVIDIDPKPISRIPHYLSLDQTIRQLNRI